MAIAHMPERNTDRTQQIIDLLGELSERLLKFESSQDALKRDVLALRESVQDTDDRNSQTQRAILATENKFDAVENMTEALARRVTGMEESLDSQSTQLIAILRKIEERFEDYDREYKNHAATINQYASTLEKFDVRLEKMQTDKSRLARKIDALEFQLADTQDKIDFPAAGTFAPPATDKSNDLHKPDKTETPEPAPRDGIQVWSPTPANGPVFMAGPSDIPVPKRKSLLSPRIKTAIGQYGAYAALSVFLIAVSAGAISTLLNHPSVPTTETTASTATATSDTPVAVTENTTTAPAPVTPPKDFFSASVRKQIDDQVVAARKLEDTDAAKLMISIDAKELMAAYKPDTSLPRAIAAIQDKAADGTPAAQHDMGALYTTGSSGVKTDYTRAAFWFRLAAQNGVANARYNLGVLYQQGLGVPKDIDTALSWYRAASLLEHPEARYNLGIAYVEGIGVAYNPAMAAGYFEQAARSGVIEAAYNLGLILDNGLIDEPRPYEGLFWYKLAADGGSADGARALARLKSELKMTDAAWNTLFAQMVKERPDLKALAESRKALAAANTPVRIHTPQTADSALVRKINEATTNPTPTSARITPPALPVNETTDTLPPKVLPTVTAGATPDAQMVSRIQLMLADEGLYTGTPDGAMGPMTSDAIRRYQTKYNMNVDGKPSTALMAQMLARRLADTAEPAAGTIKQQNTNHND